MARDHDEHATRGTAGNPKTSGKVQESGQDNQIKDPDDWVSGDEPMTGAQASYLKTLSEQAHQPEAFDPDLSKSEASRRIDALREARKR
jgi:hypothetical protein